MSEPIATFTYGEALDEIARLRKEREDLIIVRDGLIEVLRKVAPFYQPPQGRPTP